MDQQGGDKHNELRQKTPTKISRTRAIFVTPRDTLNSSPGEVKSAPDQVRSRFGIHAVRQLGWDKSTTFVYDVIFCEYQGIKVKKGTEGLQSMKLTLESARNCYCIYFQLSGKDDALNLVIYFQGIAGVLISNDKESKIYCIDFALKDDVSRRFGELKSRLNLPTNDFNRNCTTLRIKVKNTQNLVHKLFKSQLFDELKNQESKCTIKESSSESPEIDLLQKELREDGTFSAQSLISSQNALSQFKSYAESQSTPETNSKRSYHSHSNSPDSVFAASMQKRSIASKPRTLQSFDLSNEATENESLPTPSKYSTILRRSVRNLAKQVSSFSSKEFAYIDPEFDSNTKFLFSFPEGENDSVDISTYEEARLAPGVWLNDNLIDFDLKYIFSQLKDELKPKVHIFNSFFYKRLCSAPMPTTVSNDPEKTKKTGYDPVRSWTRNTNIFDKDFILVPICENLHWFLAIICYPKYMLAKRDTDVVVNLESDDEKAPLWQEFEDKTVILVFDSLGLTTGLKLKHVLDKLRSYLIHEAYDKGHGEAFRDSCTGFSVVVPRQDNFSDCGCFLLEYAERFLKGKSTVATFHEILQSKGTPEGYSGWFPPSCASNRRSTLQNLIKSMGEDYAARASSRMKPEIEDRSSDIEEIIL